MAGKKKMGGEKELTGDENKVTGEDMAGKKEVTGDGNEQTGEK